MDDQTSSLRACYRILEDKVTTTLQIRTGDQAVLGAVQDEALTFVGVIEEVCRILGKGA